MVFICQRFNSLEEMEEFDKEMKKIYIECGMELPPYYKKEQKKNEK